MIRARVFRAGRPPASAELADWRSLCQDDANLLWVDLEAPTDQELARAVEVLSIDPRAAELARRTNRRPLARSYPGHLLVTVLSLDVHETGASPRIRVAELDLFVGRNFLLSLQRRPLPCWKELEERTSASPALGGFDSAYLLFVVLDTLVGHFARELDEVEDEVERLEERLLREPGRGALDRVVLLKRHVATLRRLVSPHREALGALVAADTLVAEQHVELYFRDLLAHLGALIEQLDHIRDMLTGAYNLYLSNISYRTNREVKVLTYLSAVLLPMSVLAGLFGTNFRLAEYETWQGFYVMLAGMGLLATGMLLFFRFRR